MSRTTYSGHQARTPGFDMKNYGISGLPTCTRLPAVCERALQSRRKAAPAITLVTTSVPAAEQTCNHQAGRCGGVGGLRWTSKPR